MSLAEGSLVQNRDNVRGAVYVVYPNRMIRGFTSEEVFKQMGYSYSMVHTTDITQYTEGTPIATVEEHAPGTDIVDARTSSVYRIMGSNAKLAYPTAAIYNTWHTYNYDFSRVIPMNEFDRQIEVVGTMQNR